MSRSRAGAPFTVFASPQRLSFTSTTRQNTNDSRVAQSDSDTGLQAQGLCRSRLALCSSHALSTWGQRMWEFDVGLLMLELYPDSLLLVSAYGLVSSAVQVLLGAYVGSYVDRTPRLKAGRSILGALGSTLSVEKEWTRALCQGDSAALARLNSGMRRIDLTCLIAAPIAAGLVMTYFGTPWAILLITAWNLAAWFPECWLLTYAQRQAPGLRREKEPTPTKPAPFLSKLANGWSAYIRQPVLPAAVALALLYLTVLSLGLLMTAYLKWGSMTEAELSLWRGAGALSGIAATFTFPLLRSRAGLPSAGLAGIILQLLCLVTAVFPALLSRMGALVGKEGAIRILVAGVAASRFGLWTFDLALTQMLQEWVDQDQLGAVNGVQSSLQSVFTSLSYVAGLVLWRPEQFEWLMLGSCGIVLTATIMFSLFACAHRSQDDPLPVAGLG
ncbi:hypothetical protein WJX72_006024 [[Myrmecia] bisecta]|uniref:Solute carrier family 40 member n=1 Tax=[Myrmecia] bisecta TaxID=41462 RepID=A0AAW1Q370_9CHLO